jgi:hypothetical protein
VTPSEFIQHLNFFHRKTLGNTEALRLYNIIYQDLQARAPWWWLETTDATLDAVDDTPINLPTDCRMVWEVKVDGDVYLPVKYTDRASVSSRAYYLLGKTIGFPGYSNAGATNNVEITYLQIDANLTAVDATPLCPDLFDPFFVERGVGLAWRREGNYGKGANHLQDAENMLTPLIAENNKRIKAQMRRAKQPDEFYRRRY